MKVSPLFLTLFFAIACFCAQPMLAAQASCNGCGGDACGSNDCGSTDCGGCGSDDCGSCRLLGLFLPSDPSFSDYISPMTNPTMFEDPRTLTEVRVIALNQKVPAALGGQNAQLYMMQLRGAVTDRLSFILTKDGYFTSDSPLLLDGWANVMLGLKYNLVTNYDTRRMLTIGFSYEGPWGSPQALQGTPRAADGQNVNGQCHVFLTGGTPIGCDGHWISALGVRAALDPAVETSMFYWSNHFDKEIGMSGFYAVAEVNWYHWYDSGNNVLTNNLNGGDLINLGSTGVAKTDIVTGGLGIKYKPSDSIEVGAIYEAPLSNRRGIMEDRVTLDVILRY